jgi:ADP-ribose pyrophosphatase YjhB (NUDIX family)
MIKFCTQCGHAVEERHTYGRLRPVCPSCGHIHFIDPKVAAAVLIERDGKVLLTRRAHDPQKGLWVPPGGFVDYDEDPRHAAIRECEEETGLKVEITELVDVISSVGHAEFRAGGASIVIFYRARVVGGELAASDDADQAGYFGPGELPELAFEPTKTVLESWGKKSSPVR